MHGLRPDTKSAMASGPGGSQAKRTPPVTCAHACGSEKEEPQRAVQCVPATAGDSSLLPEVALSPWAKGS